MAATQDEVIINAILAGTREYLANAQRVTAANEEMAGSTEMVGRASETATKRSYLMNQALFTVRRLMYATTLATIASGVAAVKWGWDFNSAMQQARVALAPISGELGGVNKELNYLFNFTKFTPFQFKDVTIAFRQMYLGMRTVGISADTVNETLKAIVDSLAATGRTSPGALNRVAVALQHMAYQGHLTGQVVLQLARDGLPIYAALRTELGLTADQMHTVGALGIPSLVALQALNKYIETTPGLANAAYRQATGSLHGLFTTFRDNISQLMGAVELNFFKRLQGDLVNMNKWLGNFQERTKGATSIASIVAAIDPALLPLWRELNADLNLFWQNVSAIIHGITHSGAFWGTIYLGLVALHGILLLLNPLLRLSQYWLDILIPLWITYKGVTMAAAIATGINVFVEKLATTATKDLTFAQFLFNLYTGEYAILARASTAAMWLYVTAQLALGAAMDWVKMQAIALWIVLELNPIILIITAVIALVALIVILYFKWKWFHDLINHTFSWIMSHWKLIGVALVAPFALAAYEIYKHWDTVKKFIEEIYSWIVRKVHAVTHLLTNLWHHIPGHGAITSAVHLIPGLASGGTVASPGLTWVGERGPELLSLPVGATVHPLDQNSPVDLGAALSHLTLVVEPADIIMDGKKVGNIVFKHYSLVKAHK